MASEMRSRSSGRGCAVAALNKRILMGYLDKKIRNKTGKEAPGRKYIYLSMGNSKYSA